MGQRSPHVYEWISGLERTQFRYLSKVGLEVEEGVEHAVKLPRAVGSL